MKVNAQKEKVVFEGLKLQVFLHVTLANAMKSMLRVKGARNKETKTPLCMSS